MNACSDVHPSADAGKLERLPVGGLLPSAGDQTSPPTTPAGSVHFSSGSCATLNESGYVVRKEGI
jgi:hypothetical protein